MVNALGDATKLWTMDWTVDWTKDWTFAQDSAKFCDLECLKSRCVEGFPLQSLSLNPPASAHGVCCAAFLGGCTF